MRFIKPSTLHKELVSDMDEKLTRKRNNYKFTHSKKILRTVKTELNTINYCDTDDVTDISIKAKDHSYIRQFTSLFTIYLETMKQIELLKAHKNLILYIDATRSVLRKPYVESKMVYYYPGKK